MNRPPIVTVLGHVDHGKTSLLDALRGTDVAGGESGGITQHTGASQIEFEGKKITFIDTPGHEAFSQMRSRGGKVADIAILVVAANDGVKPQTKEAIAHAKAANVPMIVALNKIDLEGASLAKVKSQLHDEGVILEEFGGDVMCLEVSATKKTNLDKLLKSILALTDLIETKDTKNSDLEGFILESRHDSKKGNVATAVVTKGTLKLTDEILIGENLPFKVKALSNYLGKQVRSVEAGDPVEILGLKITAEPGDVLTKYSGQDIETVKKDTKDRIDMGKFGLNVVLRADTEGTLEAIKSLINKIEFEEKKIMLLLKGVGDVKESDILLASASNGIVIAFKSKISSQVKDRAEKLGVLIRNYDVIYNLQEELSGALEGVFELAEEKVKGRAEILKVFPLPSGDVVAGCYISHGRLREGDNVSIISEKEELFKTKIKTLKKANQKTNLIGKDTECGVLLSTNHEKLQPGLTIEVL
jgi:translation initiation factor IF-2